MCFRSVSLDSNDNYLELHCNKNGWFSDSFNIYKLTITNSQLRELKENINTFQKPGYYEYDKIKNNLCPILLYVAKKVNYSALVLFFLWPVVFLDILCYPFRFSEYKNQMKAFKEKLPINNFLKKYFPKILKEHDIQSEDIDSIRLGNSEGSVAKENIPKDPNDVLDPNNCF